MDSGRADDSAMDISEAGSLPRRSKRWQGNTGGRDNINSAEFSVTPRGSDPADSVTPRGSDPVDSVTPRGSDHADQRNHGERFACQQDLVIGAI